MIWEGWHFLQEDKRLAYNDKRPVKPGITLRISGEVVLGGRGFHASKRAWVALQYARGPMICWVRLGGKIVEAEDKAVATERTVLWMADATKKHYMSLRCGALMMP